MKKLIIISIFVLTLVSLTLAVTCTDSDGGKNYYVAGAIPMYCPGVTCGINADSCVNENTLLEYYCEDGETKSVEVICDSKNCQEGRCIPDFFREASWTCADGTYVEMGSESSCKSFGRWVEESQSSCEGKCNDETGECGVQNGIGAIAVNTQCSGYIETCKDYDGDRADHYYVKSYVYGVHSDEFSGWFLAQDICNAAKNKVLENYCGESGLIERKEFECVFGCEDGACLREGTSIICNDTDGGDKPFVKGVVEGFIDNDSWGIRTDACGGINSEILAEYFCKNNQIASIWYFCDCEDGACPGDSYCTDTDGGKSYTRKGYTEQVSPSGILGTSDTCGKDETEGYVKEYYCDGAVKKYEFYECYGSGGCVDGKCLSDGPSCKDNDGGKIYDKKGQVCVLGDCKYDVCESDIVLTEYYCQTDEDRESVNYECSYGCFDGACLQGCGERVSKTIPCYEIESPDYGKEFITHECIDGNWTYIKLVENWCGIPCEEEGITEYETCLDGTEYISKICKDGFWEIHYGCAVHTGAIEERLAYKKSVAAIKKLDEIKLILTQEQSGNIETIQNRMNNTEVEVSQYEKEMEQRGFSYSFQWFFGMVAEQEKEDANILRNHANELNQTAEMLIELAELVEEPAKIILLEQAEVLNERVQELLKEANNKEKGSKGFLSWFGL